jgi:tetratricopeptide (TPR) repeat protein
MNLLVALLIVLGADGYDATFDAANQAYRSRDFTAAVAQYEKLVSEHIESAAVFYNLGNAYYGAGNAGKAVAQYERALQLDPRMDAARQNLESVLKGTRRNLARPLPGDVEQALFFWAESLSFRTVLYVGIIAWTFFWFLLALRAWRPIRFLRVVAALVGLAAVLSLGAAWTKAHPLQLAVAAQAEVPVFFGKNPDEPPRFLLYEGDRVRVERAEPGWALVSTAGGDRGWVQDDRVAFVGRVDPVSGGVSQKTSKETPGKDKQ